MLSRPVKKTKRAPPTSSASEARSSRWASERSGGHSKSFGITDQSFASRIGIAIRPLATCSPWVKA